MQDVEYLLFHGDLLRHGLPGEERNELLGDSLALSVPQDDVVGRHRKKFGNTGSCKLNA
jgi:hypothetical protein